MCPVTTFAHWHKTVESLGLKQEGFIFRQKIGFDTISSNPSHAMVCFYPVI